MRFVIFVEGDTEKDVLPVFLKRCLDPHLQQPIGIQPVNFHGWANLWRDVRQKANFYLRGGGQRSDILAVVSLMDLFGPEYPSHLITSAERLHWAKERIEHEIAHDRFRQYFAVHELEAWLLSHPDAFPVEVRKDIDAFCLKPEEVNFNRPPKKRLHAIYEHRLKRGYQPRVDGAKLFRQVNPEVVRERCPVFREMIAELLSFAKKAVT